MPAKERKTLRDVTIRFAGDSGAGMQVAGDQFAHTSALAGSDISTLPDFPAEIRAPAGTPEGISSFQIHFASVDIHTPGDAVDVLVAMNPAALKVNLPLVKPNGIIIVDSSAFTPRNLRLAGYTTNPLEDGSLDGFQVYEVDLSGLTKEALKEFKELSPREVERAKNMFALGMVFWLFHRPLEPTIEWIRQYFSRPGREKYIEPNIAALKGGYAHAEATELFHAQYEVKPAKLPPGKYRNLHGNTGLVLGFVTASRKSGLPLVYAGYPITPASPILHELARLAKFGVKTFQAEDEIAAMCAAIGAAYGGGTGRDRLFWPRDRPQAGGDRSSRDGRATSSDLRHPAVWSQHRDADQNRADRSLSGDGWAARRKPGTGLGCLTAGGLL
ncbi:MAG: hypothetical protein KatS3mg115_1874 [Candidatus Poribacteria bacterium]|nr:MAG: hypothetical protein KatS3mg115_1874 [Candidatus Poribacteria bacterium]